MSSRVDPTFQKQLTLQALHPNAMTLDRVLYKSPLVLDPEEKAIYDKQIEKGMVTGRSHIPQDEEDLKNMDLSQLIDKANIIGIDSQKIHNTLELYGRTNEFKYELMKAIVRELSRRRERGATPFASPYDEGIIVGPPGAVGDPNISGEQWPYFFSRKSTRKPRAGRRSTFSNNFQGVKGDYYPEDEDLIPTNPIWMNNYIDERNKIEKQLQLMNVIKIEKNKEDAIHNEKVRRAMLRYSMAKLVEEGLLDNETYRFVVYYLMEHQKKMTRSGTGFFFFCKAQLALGDKKGGGRRGRSYKRKRSHKKKRTNKRTRRKYRK